MSTRKFTRKTSSDSCERTILCHKVNQKHKDTLFQSHPRYSKTDGDRYQLLAIPVVSQTNDKSEPFRLRCYIIDRWLHVLNVGMRISIPKEAAVENGIQDGFLLDGEVVKTKAKAVYWPFDVLRVGTFTKKRTSHCNSF
jgi:hypothetical protein